MHQQGPALPPDENWRDAGEFLRSNESTDLMARIEALGGDPVIVARAIWARTISEAGGIPGA